jgi:hypothetical protein
MREEKGGPIASMVHQLYFAVPRVSVRDVVWPNGKK